MNLSAPFIQRPIATTLLALGLAIAGFIAYFLLPVAPLPQVEFPTISVQAILVGASPEVMATAVASVLERQLGRIAGITQMTSSSTFGSTRIIVQFDLSRNIDGAARDVQSAINAARGQLPSNVNNPTYRKNNPADAPIMIIALTSNTVTTGEMYDVASSILQQKLSQVEGIGQVIVGGSSLPGVRIELNPTRLNSYGISLEEVRTQIVNANVNRPKGEFITQDKSYIISANDALFKAYQYRPLIIAYRNQSPVRLSDVAYVEDSVEDLRNAGLMNGKPAVVLVLFKQPGANVIKTIQRVHQFLPTLQAAIPAAISLKVAMDRGATISASLHDVEVTLIVAMVLVVLVAYLFLGNIRAMMIPGIAVPLSLLGTFAVMYLLGFSLNNLSLMAVTIASGFVVDDAVVVLENISRYLEQGEKPMVAALKGAKEVGFTVVSMSVSLIAAFIPILFMGGIVGRLFREFAVTLAAAIIISLVVSLTVTPMMCSRLLTTHLVLQSNRYTRWVYRVRDRYTQSLAASLDHPMLMLLLTMLTLGVTIFLFIVIPKGFFPQQDTGRIISSIQAEQAISFQAMQQKLAQFVGLIQQDPAVETVVGFIGGNNNASNAGTLYITLKPLRERKVTADAVVNRLRLKAKDISNAKLYMQAAQDLVIGGRQGSAQFQYTLSSNSLMDLTQWVPQITKAVTKLPGIADVNSDQYSQGLQMYIDIDHDTASRYGITTEQIDEALHSAFGQRQISRMYTAMNQYNVVMEVAQQYWETPATLKEIYLITEQGNKVPLSVLARFVPSSTLLSVNHQGQMPAATLSFNLLPGEALGDAVHRITQVIESLPLPATMQGAFQGTAQAFQQSLANEFILIIAALFAVYVVLGILYESLIHPITILSTLPSASLGALLLLILTDTELTIIAMIGIILLIGIVKKNAIMMIDFALDRERNAQISSRQAIIEAASLRFRPIMMTTAAALLGALPLVFGFGLGAELRRPLGIAIVGGLIVSQVLTLYTTPVIYTYFSLVSSMYLDRFRKRRYTGVGTLANE